MPLQSNGTPSDSPVNQVEGESFADETVVLDYTSYRNCTFENCAIVFHGHGSIGLVDCEFDNCDWVFNDAAANTLQFMATMYQHGGGADQIIEQTFDNIREGRV
jgi:hypothetical protein